MDSVTQLTLGAAVGEAVLGHRVGKKAPLWGAVLGTLPDLDVIANPFLTEMQALAWHRSMTHSILFVVAMAPLLGWAIRRVHRDDDVPWTRWALLVGACLGTHVALDVLTTYGTQVFWPFSTYPLIVGSVFIIDPLYTVPLATGLLVSLRWRPGARKRRLANTLGLAVSTAYLVLTLGNKLWVEHVFQTAVAAQGVDAEQVFTKPSAFNNILWTGVAEAPDGFYVGLYSLLDDDTRIDFRYVPKNHDLLGPAANSKAMERLRWFSRGYYAVSRGTDGTLRVHDLRFPRSDLGLTDSGTYVFTFRLHETPDGRITGFTQTRPDVNATGDLIRRFVERIKGNEALATAPRVDASGALPSAHPGPQTPPQAPPNNKSLH